MKQTPHLVLLLLMVLVKPARTQHQPYPFPGGVKVYGLGEATHASGEFMLNKTAIILDLVRNQNLKGICFEVPYYNGLLFNDYIQAKKGVTLGHVLEQANWMFNVKEFGALLDSLRNINQKRGGHDRVFIYGFDAQASAYDLKKVILHFIPEAKTDSVLAQKLRLYKKTHVFMPDAATVNELNGQLDRIRALTGDKLAPADTHPFETFMLMARQDLEIRQHLQDTVNPGMDLREKHNASNIIAFQKEQGAIAVWAHNYHIAKHHDYGMTMGSLLKEHYGDGYFSLGYAFKQGSFLAWSPDNKLKAHTVQTPAGYYPAKLPFNKMGWVYLSSKALPGSRQNFIEVGSGFMGIEPSTIPFTPAVSFDGMIGFEHIHAPGPNYPLAE